MPLADFLATAGRGTVIGNVAQAFGGRTPGQSAIDDFINNQLPVIEQNVRKATTRDEINNALTPLIFGGMKVGYPQKDIENLAGMLAGPALEGLQANEIAKIRRDYGPQTTPITPQVAPEGQGQPLGLDTVFAPQTTPARNPLADPEGALRVAQALGANPAGYKQLLETQSEIENRQAEAKQNATSAAKTERQLQDIEALKGGAPVTPGILGSLHPAGLVGAMEGRQLPPSLYGAVGTPRFQPELQKFLTENPSAKREDVTALMTQHNAALSGARQADAAQRAAGASERAATAGERAATAGEQAAETARFNRATELRREFNTQSKGFQETAEHFGRIREVSKSTLPDGSISPAAGIALLNSYSKMVDPGNRVTDSDFKNAATAKPFLDRAGISWDAVKTLWEGGKMTPGQVRDFSSRAQSIYGADAQKHQQLVNEYKRLAESYKLNPNQIVTEMGAPSPEGGGGAPKILKIERMP